MEDRLYDFFAASLQDGYVGRLVEIVEKAGGARNLYNMKDYEIEARLGVSRKMAAHIIKCKEEINLEEAYEEMLGKDIKFVCYRDEDYPEKLKNIPSKPYALFVKGNLPNENSKSVAVVGARECTEYGRLMAEYFGSRLALKKINVISGMAWGIDGIAQMSSIKSGGKSYAVLGCGVDVIYPRKNYELYERLLEEGSGVISEYAPGTRAESRRFPPRNRIISAFSDVVLVVEARERSGTLITVDMANAQGKTIMIVPGRITDPLSVGCLKLMKDGAIPALGIEDVLDELGVMDEEENVVAAKEKKAGCKKNHCINIDDELSNNEVLLTEDERIIYNAISIDPMDIDSISARLNLPIEKVMVCITSMEMKGIIKECAPGFFVKAYLY